MNKIYFSNDFITNFKPNTVNNLNNFSFFKKKKNEIFSKNFFLFLFLIKYNLNSNRLNFKKISFFIKPLKKKVFTVLRSPYRHKLARQQFYILRYCIKLVININLNKKIVVNKFNHIIKFINFLKKLNYFFETNIVYNHKSTIKFNFFFENNFKLTNFY